MKITYYPTLPSEYNIARFPTLSGMEGFVWKTKSNGGYLMMTENDILTCIAERCGQGEDGHHVKSVKSIRDLTDLSTLVAQEKTHAKSVTDSTLIVYIGKQKLSVPAVYICPSLTVVQSRCATKVRSPPDGHEKYTVDEG